MGNLINDFWTYSSSEGKSYYGIVEVIKGDLEKQARSVKKYENNIHKALEYTMNNRVLSHISIQTYCYSLKERINREENEQKYYPFILEFEDPKGKSENYNNVVMEAVIYINHLITKYGVNKQDILVMINNNKSIYVSINPKAYGLKPSKILHKTYTNMYEELKEEIGLHYIDPSIVVSHYKLMKTPNSYYKGGYFVRISVDQLSQLMLGSVTKYKLTRERRSLDIEVPGQISFEFAKLYKNSHKKALGVKNDSHKRKKNKNNPLEGKCVEMFMGQLLEKGNRNKALVSVGIYLKNLGYTRDQVKENLIMLGQTWNHDENQRKIEVIVNTIFHRNYSFSCSYVRSMFDNLDTENICSKCPYCKSNKIAENNDNTIDVDRSIVSILWEKRASTRHYLLYLDLLNKDLFNKSFNPEDYKINVRTLGELVRFCGDAVKKKRNGNGNEIIINYERSENSYSIPTVNLDRTVEQLGEYIKHYLKMLVDGYEAHGKYILFKISKQKLAKKLGYTNISGLYKLLEKLQKLGYIKMHRNNMFELHYETYKVIELNRIEEKSEIPEVVSKVVGEQICVDFVKNNERFIWNIKNKADMQRGSP